MIQCRGVVATATTVIPIPLAHDMSQEFKYHGMVDPRRPVSEREGLAREFLTLKDCCLRPGLWRRLHALLTDPEGGFGGLCESQKLNCLMYTWATPFWHAQWQLQVSVADIEKCHAKTKRWAHSQNNFSLLAAKFLNGELAFRHAERQKLKEKQLGEQQAQGPVEQLGSEPVLTPDDLDVKLPVNKKSLMDLFRADYYAEKRAEAEHVGTSIGCCVTKQM